MKASVRNQILTSLKIKKIPGIDVPCVIAMKIPFSPVQKQITINEILEIGIVMDGAVPQIYDTLNLTGAEKKILSYIFKNVVRVYSEVVVYPRDDNASARFWRSKELMAQDCKVSPTTFRLGVRHLAELGVVTSMDPTDPYEYAKYSVTLEKKFITLKTLSTDPFQKYHELTRYLYGDEAMKNLNLSCTKQDSFYSFTLPSEEKEKYLKALRQKNAHKRNELNRVSINKEHIDEYIQQQPDIENSLKSKDIRTAQFSTSHISSKQLIRNVIQARKKLEWVLSPEERKIMQVKQYYEYKCRQALNTGGFCCLSTKRPNWREDKRWVWLTRLYTQCKENSWNYKAFIDAQFDRLQWFKRPQKYVYLNQFFSAGAINYYSIYVRKYKSHYSVDGNIKVKTDKVKTFIRECIDAVVEDCERMQYFLKTAPKRPAYKQLSPEEIKIMYISLHWTSLSKYYLANLSWFLNWLKGLHQYQLKTVQKLADDISALQKSPSLMKKINKEISHAERLMGIPKTMELKTA